MDLFKYIKLIRSWILTNKKRYLGLVTVVTVLGTVLLSGMIIIISLRNGINCLEERMGADLMIVPLGEESKTESILIKGEPGYYYLEKDVADKLNSADIEGIEKYACQFYLVSSNQGCCDIPVQFIGIDEKEDFTVQPWIKETLEKDVLTDGSIVVGSDIDVPEDGKIKFFGRYYTIGAQLEETGTGLDQAAFSNMNTIRDLYDAAKKKGFTFIDGIDPDNNISTILIRVSEGYTPAEVKHNIRASIDGLQVIETKSMTNSVENSLSAFVIMLYILLIVIFVLSLVILSVVFKLSVYERTAQLLLMRSIGATGRQIKSLILLDAFVVSVIGTIIGVVITSLVVFPFRTAISSAVAIPFLFPGLTKMILIYISAVVISVLSGPVSAYISAGRFYKSIIS